MKKANPLIQWFKQAEITAQDTELQDLATRIATVEENMKLLSQELQQVSLYFSGNEVTTDV